MRQNIAHLWGHLFALLFTAALLLVGINFFQLQPLLSAFILSIFAAVYLAAAFISRRALIVYPGTLLLAVAYNLLLYGLGLPAIYLPLANSPLVFVFYLLARRLRGRALSFISSGLDGSTILLVLALALALLFKVSLYASSAPVVAFLSLTLLALYFYLCFAVEHKTWHLWAFTLLAVPGYLFLLHGHAPQALYLASAVMLLVAAWNLTRKQMGGESALLVATALYVAGAAYLHWLETSSPGPEPALSAMKGQALIPVGYAACAVALVSLSLSQHRRLQEVAPSLAAGLVLTLVPVALTYPWSQYTALFGFLALVFLLYTLAGSALLRRDRTMPGLMVGHSHVGFGEVVALGALAYGAVKGFPLSYANALTALLMAAVAVLAALRVRPIVVKFRRHFFYLAGLLLTFSFLIAVSQADPWHNTAANLSLTVPLVLLLYGVAELGQSRVDRAGYETLLEVPVITVAAAGALYLLGRSPGFSADLLLLVGLMLPGALAYWRGKHPQAWGSPVVGLAVLVLAVLMAAGASDMVAALVFLALGVGLVAWEVQRAQDGWSYVRLFSLGVVTLTSVGLSYPWRVPQVFVVAVWPVVYLVAASFYREKERHVARVSLEVSGYVLMLLVGAALAVHAPWLPVAIIAALYALTFFVMTARAKRAAYLYPASGFTVLAVFLAVLVAGLGAWYILLAFPLTAIFYAAGAYTFPHSSLRVGRGAGVEGEKSPPLYFGGHLNALVGGAAFFLFTTQLNEVAALAGAALHLIAYAWMAYRRWERVFLAGAGLSLSLLLLIGLSFLPFVEPANVMAYFIPVALLLLCYGWLLQQRKDTVGSQAIFWAAGVVALLSGGAALWAEWLSPASVWTVLVVGSLVWLGLLLVTRLDIFVYLITASLALLGYSFLRTVSDRFVNHIFIFLVYGCLLIAMVFVYDLISRRMKFRAPIHFGRGVLRRDWLIYSLPVVVLAGVALTGFGVESTSSPPFCNLCHKMSPYYTSWQASTHGQAGASCADCHYEPGAQSYVRNKIVGLSELVKTATATEGYRPMAVVSDRSCLRGGCHTIMALKITPVLSPKGTYGGVADRVSFPRRGLMGAHGTHLERTLRGVEIRCTVCHAMTRAEQHFSINEDACFLCHFKDRQDRPTAAGGCLGCHDAIRTRPTKGGFSHEGVLTSQQEVDCTGCHQAVTSGGGGIKEVCSSCHLQDSQELLRGDPAKIHRLHVTGEGVRCNRCHEKIRHGEKALVPPAVAPTTVPAVAPTTAPTVAPTQAAAGTPPKTPKSHEGRTQCLICHAAGVVGAPKVPQTTPNHTDFKDDNQASLCWSCHPSQP